MISREDLESFLIRTEMDNREIGEAMWLVDPVKDAEEDHPAVVVSLSPPLVIFRASIGTAPEGDHARLKLYQTQLPAISVEHAIKRIAASEQLKHQIAQSDSASLAGVFAEAGIWYDALSALTDQIEARPGDAELVAARADLLAQVDLGEAAAARN